MVTSVLSQTSVSFEPVCFYSRHPCFHVAALRTHDVIAWLRSSAFRQFVNMRV